MINKMEADSADTGEYQPSGYQKMLNNIANDLDLLLNEMCDSYQPETSPDTPRFQTFAKSHQTYPDSNTGRGEDSAFGTLASTDSYSSEQKPISDSLRSAHLDVFGLDNKGLEIPTYPDKTSSGSDGHSQRYIPFSERLSKTHSIWYLPDVGRSGAVHLLKDRDIGNFIVRKSSQPETLALSVQFPENEILNVDHYLILSTEHGFALQGSNLRFRTILILLTYYHENMEELPHTLTLPPTIMRARTLQELTSLSHLGQDFWMSYSFDKGPNACMTHSNSHHVHSHSPQLHKSTSEPIDITRTSAFMNPSSSHMPARRSKTSACLQNIPLHRTQHSDSSLGLSNGSSLASSRENLSDQPSSVVQTPSNCSSPFEIVAIEKSSDHGSSIHDRTASDPDLQGLKNSTELKGQNIPVCVQDGSPSAGVGSPSARVVSPSAHVGSPSTRIRDGSPSGSSTCCSVCDKCGSSLSKTPQTDGSSSSVNSLENARFTEERALSQRSPCPPQSKSSLYFTTSLDLLHLPDNQYFKSNLSDKMSDYEDIWKSSAAPTPVPSVKTSTVNTPAPSIKDSEPCTPSPLTKKQRPYCSNSQQDQNVNLDNFVSSNKKQQILQKDVLSTCVHNDLNSGKLSSHPSNNVSSSVKVKRKMHRALSLDESHKQSRFMMGGVMTEMGGHRTMSEQVIDKPKASVQTQTSPLMTKNKPPILSLHGKGSSSSGSSVKSPVYAEPFDSLDSSQVADQKQAPRVRRRSAPSMGANVQSRKLRGISHNPTLETIFSPRCLQQNNAANPVSSFEFSTHGANDESCSFGAECLPPSGVGLKKGRSLSTKSFSSVLSKDNIHQVVKKLENLQVEDKYSGKKCKSNKNSKQKQSSDNTNKNSPPGLAIMEDFNPDSVPQSTSTLRKFPVYQKQISLTSTHSEYSTMEDIISCENPSLTVKAIPNMPIQNYRVLSEYDNLTVQYAPPSARSRNSTGTEFCKPWDNNFFDTLMQSGGNNPRLFPTMDVNERIKAWQEDSEQFQPGKPDTSVRNSVLSTSTLVGSDTEDELISDNPNYPVVVIHPPSSHSTSVENLDHQQTKSSHRRLQVSHHQPSERLQASHHRPSERLQVSHHQPSERLQASHPQPSERLQASHHKPTASHIPAKDFVDEDCQVIRVITNGGVAQRNKGRHPGIKIKDFITKLSQDKNTTFGSTIENFLQCTTESPETSPQTVTRNVRQFMTGIRNYLVKHELEDVIENERKKLRSNEILNVDAIIEESLHLCVLQPLKQHIYQLFVTEYTKNGSLQLLSENIRYARTKTAEEIGLRPGLSPPDSGVMESIKQNLVKMQKAYSPLRKLEYLLSATTTIYQCATKVSAKSSTLPVVMGADDFLPMLIYVLVHCGMVTAEIESDYIWGLIHPSLLNGEGGYYLTSLSSAVLVLKKFKEMQENKTLPHEGHLPSISDIQAFLKIAIPDELRDSIIWKTLPVRPKMHTKDVCALIAHKFKVTNPQDYGLYILEKGEERRLQDSEIPQDLKAAHQRNSKECVFAYKRNAANIAWPVSLQK